LGEEAPDSLESMRRLGSFLRVQRRLDEADLLLGQALETGLRVLEENNDETIALLVELARLREAQGRSSEAAKLSGQAVEFAEEVKLNNDWQMVRYRLDYGPAFDPAAPIPAGREAVA
jgi:hypothetical protein